MRQFIRHPTDIPITYSWGDSPSRGRQQLKNINQGGLCFSTRLSVRSGASIRIVISLCKPPFQAEGEVVWCRRTNKHYEVGVKFHDAGTQFAVRMVEQICHIEHYKNEVLRREGRWLSGEQAAIEWIGKYAADFP